MEIMTSPKTSSWRWRAAPFPMRTGRESLYPDKWSSVSSLSDEPRLMPYTMLVLPSVSLHCSISQWMWRSAPVVVAEAVEDVHGEGGVAQPREAVVPVAGASDGFRQAGGRRGDYGPRFPEHHQVKHQEGADYCVPPQALVVHGCHELLPIAARLVQLNRGVQFLHACRAAVTVR